MKAVDIKGGRGERDALFINPQTPKPTASHGQAIVKIKAFGINRMDIVQRRGMYPLPPQAPATLGVEFSGTIESLGPGDHGGFQAGDEVLGLAYGGAYAECVAVSSRMLLQKPGHMSFEQAAAVPEAWITATQALHMVLGFERGKSILWHAGASGVSIAGIQLSRASGASAVYATAGSDDKCAFVTREIGAAAAFNYKTTDWVKEIKDKTGGRGVDYIVDFVGADYFQKNLDVAARDARIVLLGTLSGGKVPCADISQILYKRIRIEGSTLRSRDEQYQGELRDRLETYCPEFASGKLKIIVDKVMPWEEIQEAHKYMEDAKNTGKIVCTIS
ncbi:Alcohol dehydrogenase superfamily, zinc-type [Metarhizium album ARSEF 1941]|uniref:Alcohol dehydrogenase superfamily, zinc-type n=1 Tax=Metarhizium album (strain ARSEF 1941) TaxID=1081103 RepID=A0A0B2WSU1_METAS|nr:Alcohol dehydrogenase superfamily, zinc-type [Metarhizium album ARSEF 1941]KHN96684.1 Alcohol dehydrogenase superfamily, zinc-type [Metarhizium album ARSEF 1941]